MMVLLSFQLQRFLLVGSSTVGIDFVCYFGCLELGIKTAWAKAIGFIAGMIFAWFANRIYTFSSQGGRRRFFGFTLLYILTLVLNVSVNQYCLLLLSPSSMAVLFAFIVATGISAAANFIGMKFFVFR